MTDRDIPDVIDAVADVIYDAVGDFMLVDLHVAEDIARALAEAGWLRTAEDRAVIDVFNEYAAAIRFTDDQGMTDPVRTSRAVDALYKLAYGRGRVAVGGSVPADPEPYPGWGKPWWPAPADQEEAP
jgi:hypothetical protein